MLITCFLILQALRQRTYLQKHCQWCRLIFALRWTLHPRYFISQYGASKFAMFNSDGSYARSQDYGGDLTVDVWHRQWPITGRLLPGTTYANKAKYCMLSASTISRQADIK